MRRTFSICFNHSEAFRHINIAMKSEYKELLCSLWRSATLAVSFVRRCLLHALFIRAVRNADHNRFHYFNKVQRFTVQKLPSKTSLMCACRRSQVKRSTSSFYTRTSLIPKFTITIAEHQLFSSLNVIKGTAFKILTMCFQNRHVSRLQNSEDT